MDMTGEYRIPASRERVWAALNDPDTLQKAIPGCEELKKISDTELEAVARAKIGPVSARFKGKVTLSDLQPPSGYTLTGEGTGGAAGFAKGQAKVTLEPDGDNTILRYTVNATVGGKLAQIGQRLIDGAAKKMADDFFEQFAVLASGGAASVASQSQEVGTQPAPTAPREAAIVPQTAGASTVPSGRISFPMWVPIAVIAAGVVLLIVVLAR